MPFFTPAPAAAGPPAATAVVDRKLTSTQEAAFQAYYAQASKAWADLRAQQEAEYKSVRLRGMLERNAWQERQLELFLAQTRRTFAEYRRLYLSLAPGQRAWLDTPAPDPVAPLKTPSAADAPAPLDGASASGAVAASLSVVPDPNSFADFYPVKAARTHTQGRATLTCQVSETGILNTCEVKSESPAGLGFGNAAIQLTSLMRLHPALLNGAPVPSTFTLPVNFNLPD